MRRVADLTGIAYCCGMHEYLWYDLPLHSQLVDNLLR